MLRFGRDGVIRTLDPLHPMQVRYQAALRPDGVSNCWKRPKLYRKHLNVERFFCKFLAAQNREYVF